MRNDTCWDDADPARKRAQIQVQKDYEGVQMKSSREQFDEWVTAMVDGLPENMARIFEDMLFTAWQASREAIEIELPSREDPANFFCEVYDCDLVHESLANCGLKVKS